MFISLGRALAAIHPGWGNRSQQGPLRRIWSLGALGEGSGWDLRIRPQPAAASGNLEIMKFGLKWVHMARYGLIQPPK